MIEVEARNDEDQQNVSTITIQQIDQDISRSRKTVRHYGRLLWFGGLFILVAAIACFFVAFLRLNIISKKAQQLAELRVELNEGGELTEADYQQQRSEIMKTDSSHFLANLLHDEENERALEVGNSEALLLVCMVNCFISILFGVQGILMMAASSPILTKFRLEDQGVPVPKDVQAHLLASEFIEQRKKLSIANLITVINTLLLLLETILRVIMNLEVREYEALTQAEEASAPVNATSTSHSHAKRPSKKLRSTHSHKLDPYKWTLPNGTVIDLPIPKEVFFLFVLVATLMINLYLFQRFQQAQEEYVDVIEEKTIETQRMSISKDQIEHGSLLVSTFPEADTDTPQLKQTGAKQANAKILIVDE